MDLIAIEGCIVTIDAMGCQKAIAKKIVDSGADYVLAVKKNNRKLYESLELFFRQVTEGNGNNIDYHETFTNEHGRKDNERSALLYLELTSKCEDIWECRKSTLGNRNLLTLGA